MPDRTSDFDRLAARCVNPETEYPISAQELTAFHDHIRMNTRLNGVREAEEYLTLDRDDREAVLRILASGPFEELDNLNSTGTALLRPGSRDVVGFTIYGSDRHDIRPWVSLRPYRSFPHFLLSVAKWPASER